jgi:uncharacterized protein
MQFYEGNKINQFAEIINNDNCESIVGSKIIASRLKMIDPEIIYYDNWGFANYEDWGFTQAGYHQTSAHKNKGTILLKTTSACNLSCDYCYAASNFSRKLEIMETDILEKVIRDFLDITFRKNEIAEFIWHGGEPLLAKQNFFQKAFRLQEKYRANKQKILNSIQSNGTFITNDLARFFKDYDVRVGISIDGPKTINDKHRLYKSGSSSFKKTLEGIKILQQHGIQFGVLAVVTPDSIGMEKEILDFFVSNNWHSIDFLPCAKASINVESHNSSLISTEQFSEFMVRIFDLFFNLNRPEINIRFIDNIMVGLLGGKPFTCKFSGNCSKFVAIKYDGDIYFPCESFIDDKDFKIENIKEISLNEIYNSSKYLFVKNQLQDVNSLNPNCKECKWSTICNGGCSAHRYYHSNDLIGNNYFCQSRKVIFDHIYKKTNVVIDRFINLNRNLANAVC